MTVHQVEGQLVRAGSGADEFLRRANNVYEDQRRKVLDIEAEHQRRRTETQSGYARKLADVAYEGTEALRRLDAEHANVLSAEKAKLETIGRLRHG
jgi:hypothetical protein